MTHPADQQPPDDAPVSPGPVQPAPQPPQPAYATPPGGYPVPPTAVPGYGYPPGVARQPVPFAPGGAPLAEFWQRLVAYFLDGLIVGAVTFIPTMLLFAMLFIPIFSSAGTGSPPDAAEILLLELVGLAAFVAIQIVASYFYFVRMCHKTGQTVGKRVMKIRLVRAIDGGPIDLRIAKRRWLVQHVSGGLAPYFNLADGLWQLWDQPHRQCLHDKCADTVVVQVTA